MLARLTGCLYFLIRGLVYGVCALGGLGLLDALGLLIRVATPAMAQVSAPVVSTIPSSPVTWDLHLEVFINGVSTRLISHLRHTPAGRLLMEPEPLRNVGLLTAAQALRDDGWVDLSLLPGVSTRYEEATQTLHVQAQDTAMVVRVFDAQQQETLTEAQAGMQTAPHVVTQHVGAFLNHTLYASMGGKRWAGLRRYQYASGLFEGNLYGPLGNVSSTQLINVNRNDADAARRFRSVRLDTQWSWFDEDRLMTFTAGDFVGSSLSWSRATRLGGLQIRRNFAIRPDLITMPMLSDLSGSAAVPSTVELYVNNAQRFSQDVAPGPFAITNLPLITGAGTARLVVRDALGRETISETPFYASSALLAQGLSDFALEAGFARRNYGVTSYGYDQRLLVSTMARVGLSNAITLEGHAQAGGRLALIGVGSVFRLGPLGVAGLAGSVSRYGTGADIETGAQLAASLELEAGGFRFYARHQRTENAFNDLASITLTRNDAADPSTAVMRRHAGPPRRMSQISLSLPHWLPPSVNLSYTPITQANGTSSRLAGVSLSQRLPGNGSLSVSAYRDLARKHSSSVFATLSWFLGNKLNASTSRAWNQGRVTRTTVELSQSEQNGYGSVGWRLRAAHGHGNTPSRTQAASASYRSRIGRIEAEVEHRERHRVNGRVQVDGALVFAGGGVFLTNHIFDSFGVVNVGAPDVQVRYENTPIGNTDTHGQLLLTGLRAYERNQISINPMTLPVDARIPMLRQIVRPRSKSGVVVDFNVALTTRTALVTVRDVTGELLPVGAQAQLNDGATTVVGYDGQVWLEDVAQINRLRVQQADKPDCVVDFIAPERMTERLLIPDAMCRSE